MLTASTSTEKMKGFISVLNVCRHAIAFVVLQPEIPQVWSKLPMVALNDASNSICVVRSHSSVALLKQIFRVAFDIASVFLKKIGKRMVI